jgi:hypothetical protein
MEVLGTASHAEFVTKVRNDEHRYASAISILPSGDCGTAQEEGDGFNKTQSNIDPNPEQSWVDSTQQPPCSNALSVGETVEKNATTERKFHVTTLLEYFAARSLDSLTQVLD